MPQKFERLHGRITGRGESTIVLGHGFGCDQTAWSKLLPWLEDRFRVVGFDFAGCGPGGELNYHQRRHASLFGYADDLVEILDELHFEDCVYIGHSVDSMVGAAASITRPRAISRLVMIAGSPCYLNQAGYQGGFEQSDLNELYNGMAANFQAWAAGFVPAVVGIANHAVIDEFSRMLFLIRPDIALAMVKVIFQSDLRALIPRLQCDVHIVQPRRDIAVPLAVARWMRERVGRGTLNVIESEGHVPHITEPAAVLEVLQQHLMPLPVPG